MKKKKLTGKKIALNILFTLSLILFLIFICIPIYWCMSTSFKELNEVFRAPITFWPEKMSFENYVNAWKLSGFNVFFKNSAIVAVGAVIGDVVIALITGYALTRYDFKIRTGYLVMLLCTQFIPGAMLLTPMYLIFKDLGLTNSLFSLILVYITFRIPFDSMLMRQFISGIDYTIEEAAQIDGCNRFETITRILLPLLKPGVATVAAYSFISCWNEFLYAYMFINKQTMLTLPVGLKHLLGEFMSDFGQIAAGAVIAVIPALILFSYVQKGLVSGVTAGAVKG